MRPIISFLNTLNDENFDKKEPQAVPSGLPVGTYSLIVAYKGIEHCSNSKKKSLKRFSK